MPLASFQNCSKPTRLQPVRFSFKLILVGQGWLEVGVHLGLNDYRNHMHKRDTEIHLNHVIFTLALSHLESGDALSGFC